MTLDDSVRKGALPQETHVCRQPCSETEETLSLPGRDPSRDAVWTILPGHMPMPLSSSYMESPAPFVPPAVPAAPMPDAQPLPERQGPAEHVQVAGLSGKSAQANFSDVRHAFFLDGSSSQKTDPRSSPLGRTGPVPPARSPDPCLSRNLCEQMDQRIQGQRKRILLIRRYNGGMIGCGNLHGSSIVSGHRDCT